MTNVAASITVRESLRDAMAEAMRDDDTVFVIGEEVAEYQGAYKVTQGLLKEFGPHRVWDAPITEHGFAGLAIGAALNGLRPIVEFMTFNFAMQAIDQIINSAAKISYMSNGSIKCPIVFRGPNGCASSVAAQHSQCYASWYAHCPGLKVVSPYQAKHAKALLKKAILDDGPVVFLEHELVYGTSFPVEEDFDSDMDLGKSCITRIGNDITLIGCSWIMSKIDEAAIILANEYNIEAEVIDLLTLRPFDYDTVINSVKKTNRAVVAEEGYPFAGICSEIAYVINSLAFDDLDAPVMRVTAEDVPLPYAKNLEQIALPSTQKIVNAALSACYKA